jgi:hypothetical protein
MLLKQHLPLLCISSLIKGEIIFSAAHVHRIIKIANKNVSSITGDVIIQPNNVNVDSRTKEGCKNGSALFNVSPGRGF